MTESDMDTGSPASPKRPLEVSEYLVDKIAEQQWVGVNGTYDNESEWKEWEEMTTSFNPYSNQIVYILPYVNTDW